MADVTNLDKTFLPKDLDIATNVLYERLQELYWRSATREISNMILMFNEIWKADTDNDSSFNWGASSTSFDSHIFQNLINIWNDAIAKARAHDRTPSSEHRCVRYLLQSSGFLDIDTLVQPSKNNLSKCMAFLEPKKLSLEMLPNVEILELEQGDYHRRRIETEGLLRVCLSLICDHCRDFIKTPLYLQCSRHCVTERPFPFHILINGKIKKLKEPNDANDLGIPDRPRRLCLSCKQSDTTESNCSWDHMALLQNNTVMDDKIETFQKWIMKFGFSKSKHSTERLQHYTSAFVETGKSLLLTTLATTGGFFIRSLYNEAVRQKRAILNAVAPTGFVHLSFMFGPLIIESGVENTKGGCLISPRPLPALLWDKQSASSLIDGWDYGEPPVLQESVILYQENTGLKERALERYMLDVEKKHTLGAVKQVYGGVFSGYLETSLEEEEVIKIFLKQAKRCNLTGSKKLKTQREVLLDASRAICAAIKGLLGRRISATLLQLSQSLMDDSLLFNTIFRNCQSFVNQLLVKQALGTLFPVPNATDNSWSKSKKRFSEPTTTYLLSFGDQLIARHDDIQQPNSVVAAFLLNGSMGFDLIRFITLLLTIHTTRLKDAQSQAVEMQDDWSELLLQPLATDKAQRQLNSELINMLWLLPRDTLSILSSHLLRPYKAYQELEDGNFGPEQWITNRLRLLRQLDVFASMAGGFGSALIQTLTRSEVLSKHVAAPHSLVYGLMRADERILSIRVLHAVCYIVLNRTTPEWDAQPSNNFRDEILRLIFAIVQHLNANQSQERKEISYRKLKKIIAEKLLENSPEMLAALFGFSMGAIHTFTMSYEDMLRYIMEIFVFIICPINKRAKYLTVRLSIDTTIIVTTAKKIELV
ncbi:hypothetical protein VHEMI04258 [[Torrubiella] hemipterigena]|uniref:Uncharacterized protein n=1 Tax=[Torrubiella] hemipterigena TaxID=1531966 RepID=A0A0A1TDR9_9HYPO|nr:hypothetical protein VHEMI04258 [[Torrubiella] hemipterigena]